MAKYHVNGNERDGVIMFDFAVISNQGEKGQFEGPNFDLFSTRESYLSGLLSISQYRRLTSAGNRTRLFVCACCGLFMFEDVENAN